MLFFNRPDPDSTAGTPPKSHEIAFFQARFREAYGLVVPDIVKRMSDERDARSLPSGDAPFFDVRWTHYALAAASLDALTLDQLDGAAQLQLSERGSVMREVELIQNMIKAIEVLAVKHKIRRTLPPVPSDA